MGTLADVVEDLLDDPDRGPTLGDEVKKRHEPSRAGSGAGEVPGIQAEVAERLRTSW